MFYQFHYETALSWKGRKDIKSLLVYGTEVGIVRNSSVPSPYHQPMMMVIMMGRLCPCIIAWCIVRQWEKLQYCSHGGTTNFSLVVRCGMMQHFMIVGQAEFGRVCLCHAIATVFQLYHGVGMTYEMRREKPEPTLWQNKWIFYRPHHIGIV